MWELTPLVQVAGLSVHACGALAVRAYGSTVWRGAGVRTVYFMGTTCSVRAASPLASIDPCL